MQLKSSCIFLRIFNSSQYNSFIIKCVTTQSGEIIMLGNFKYSNPTKLYFGDQSLHYLRDELKNVGNNITLVYGGGSIKVNGIYDHVLTILNDLGKTVSEISGVMPNPTLAKLNEGIAIARNANTDFILAVGGGSVIDYAKALGASIHLDEDPWDRYFVRFEEPNCPIVKLGCVLTMMGTGSEMNAGSVITNEVTKEKYGHVFQSEDSYPVFAIMNPLYTYTLPKYQMVAGIYDIFSHICEQYFSDIDDNTSDYIAEGLMRSLIHSSRIAINEPTNYEARSNIMWTATWALNTLIAKGKSTDWLVHSIGQAVGGFTNTTHGMTLSAVSLAYYRLIMPYGLHQFKRFAINVWGVDPLGKDDTQVALLGLEAMENWMKELGLALDIRQFGVSEDMLEGIAAHIDHEGGYKVLTDDDIMTILKNSL